jgi:hypothetical protein
MKQNGKWFTQWSIFILLSIINLFIYLNRDTFQYKVYATERQLYQSQDEWYTHTETMYSDREHSAALELTGSVVKETQSTQEKLTALSLLLLSQFHAQRGNPTPHLLRSGPIESYYGLLESKDNKLFCSHFANMMLLFASVHNIKGRMVEVAFQNEHHVFPEFFIREWGKWVLTDIYNDILFARNEKGKYLNALEFRREINSSRPVIINAFNVTSFHERILDKNLLPIKANHTQANLYHYYKTTNLNQVYTFKNKVIRYFGINPWYYIYLDGASSNSKHYLKLLLLGSWLFSGVRLALGRFK